ncbi:hypothetical protein BFN03_01185 [Rhodococcus sp. WMMA185]|nr:hypothetical protein BFN03_01185 [Rhodococcus sp. WMMA185]
MFGALSILMFWTFGFGIVLGIAALAAGALAIRDSLEASETPSFDALVGILTGFLGIAAGIFFLVAVSSNF